MAETTTDAELRPALSDLCNEVEDRFAWRTTPDADGNHRVADWEVKMLLAELRHARAALAATRALPSPAPTPEPERR